MMLDHFNSRNIHLIYLLCLNESLSIDLSCAILKTTQHSLSLVVPLFRPMEFVFSLIDKLNVGLHQRGLWGFILTTQLPCGTSSNKITLQHMISFGQIVRQTLAAIRWPVSAEWNQITSAQQQVPQPFMAGSPLWRWSVTRMCAPEMSAGQHRGPAVEGGACTWTWCEGCRFISCRCYFREPLQVWGAMLACCVCVWVWNRPLREMAGVWLVRHELRWFPLYFSVVPFIVWMALLLLELLRAG